MLLWTVIQNIDRGDPGGPGFPRVLKLLVELFVRAVLMEVCTTQEAQHRQGCQERNHNIVFYVYDDHISGRNSIQVQTTLAAAVQMFKKVVSQTNLGNTKTVVCTPGFIWRQQGEVVYSWRELGGGGHVQRDEYKQGKL